MRFLREIAGNYSLGMLGRGQLSEIGLYTNKTINNELSSNIIDFCPVGALTNKTTSLNYRSWDSYYIDSIDFMDSFLSSVRIYNDNLKIKRILPNYNDIFDLYWFSDKSRYFFDSLKIQRINFPLQLQKFKINSNQNFIYINSSWRNISKFILCYTYVHIDKLIVKSFLGNFIDLETINDFRTLTFKSGSNVLFNKTESIISDISINNLNFDFEFDFIKSNNINTIKLIEYNFYIFYNYNLRIENPVFNSKLRQRIIWFNFSNLFFFGTCYNLTYKYHHLSNSHFDFINFLAGKHLICNLLLKFNNICFIYGNNIFSDFFLRKNWRCYLDKLVFLKLIFFKKYNKIFDLIYLTSSISTLSSFELNFLSNINSNFNNLLTFGKINYYIGLNNLNYSNLFNHLINFSYYTNNLSIYQNSFYDVNFNYCNLLLPVYNCFEVGNLFFINALGLIKQSNKLEINLEEFIKTNKEALHFVFKNILKDNFIDNYLIQINNFLPISLLEKQRKVFFFVFKYNLLNLKYKYNNFYFISFNKNYYKSNIYCFYSKQLNIMSNIFFKQKNNFFF